MTVIVDFLASVLMAQSGNTISSVMEYPLAGPVKGSRNSGRTFAAEDMDFRTAPARINQRTAGWEAGAGMAGRGRVRRSLERIPPAEAGESRKVGVARVELALMLDRDRREMSVRRQVRRDTGGVEHSLEEFEVPRTGLEHLHERPIEPRANMVKRPARMRGLIRTTGWVIRRTIRGSTARVSLRSEDRRATLSAARAFGVMRGVPVVCVTRRLMSGRIMTAAGRG